MARPPVRHTLELVELDNGSFPRNLVVANNTLYFTAETSTGRELWKVVTVAPGHVVSIGAGVVGNCKTLYQQGQVLFRGNGPLRLGQQ